MQFKLFSISLLAVLFNFSEAQASSRMEQQSVARSEHKLAHRLDQELRQFFPANQAGATVLILKDGKAVLNKAYGLANVELQVPLKTNHLFHVASVGKQFTAAAILRLEEQAKLKLDDPITQYLTALPVAWSEIQVKHLLSHTSGIPNLFEDQQFRERAFLPHSPDQLLKLASQQKLLAAAGTQFRYASINYTLLAMIIEKTSGLSYAKFIEQEFLQILGMKNTVFDQTPGVIPNAVSPYQAGPRVAEKFHPSVGFGGGSFYSTTADLARWTLALHAGKILNHENTVRMHTPFVLRDGTAVHYGFGTRPHRLAGEAYLQSNGDIQGFHSETVYLPQSKLYVAILSNGESLPYGLVPVAKRLSVMASGKRAEADKSFKPKQMQLSTTDLMKFVGIYKNGNEQYQIHFKEGKLYLELSPNGPWNALTPLSAREFFYDSNTDFRMRFTEKENGQHLAQWFEIDALDDEVDPVFERQVTKPLF